MHRTDEKMQISDMIQAVTQHNTVEYFIMQGLS